MRDVLDVAIAVVAVDQHGKIVAAHDIAHAGAHLAEADEADIGQRVAGADQRVTTDGIGEKAGAFDQPCRERVMGAGQEQRLAARQQSFP